MRDKEKKNVKEKKKKNRAERITKHTIPHACRVYALCTYIYIIYTNMYIRPVCDIVYIIICARGVGIRACTVACTRTTDITLNDV